MKTFLFVVTGWLLLCAGPVLAQRTNLDLYEQLEKKPEYKGGIKALDKFIRKNFHPSPEAMRAKITGTVHIEFLLNEDGSISEPLSLVPVGYGIDEEAIRVVERMGGQWLPAIEDGKPIAVHWVVPIRYSTR